jgi:pSer/pThr/pTyr-binding forkhead associated (FHA) protein
VSELTLTVIRLGFLAVLWAFILTLAGVMRTDMFGQRISRSTSAPPARNPKPARSAAPSPKGKPPKPPKARRGAPRTMVVLEGSLKGTEITLTDAPITIGRAGDSTLVLNDDYASHRHARLYPHEGAWVVEDLGSTNGTYLDRTRLTAPTVVAPGTPIRVGKTTFELRR